MKPRVKAEITFLSKDCGGRKAMPKKDYLPHVFIQDSKVKTEKFQNKNFLEEESFVVRLIRLPEDGELNNKYVYILEYFNSPQVDYSKLRPTVTFAVREGSRTVGFGKILEYV